MAVLVSHCYLSANSRVDDKKIFCLIPLWHHIFQFAPIAMKKDKENHPITFDQSWFVSSYKIFFSNYLNVMFNM
jgi:hypothetical protein